jgi:hypothetical protein
VAFHQDAFGLADDVAIAEGGLQLVGPLRLGQRSKLATAASG